MSQNRQSPVLSLLAIIIFSTISVNAAGYSANMFLNGQYQNNLRSNQNVYYSVNPSNIFLEHFISNRMAPDYQAPQYLPPREYIQCAYGQQCVRKGQCQNGYYTQQVAQIENCDVETDVCCTYRAPTQKPAVSCSKGSACVTPSDCYNGQIIGNNLLGKQSCTAPNVCCQLPTSELRKDGYVFNIPEKDFNYPQPTQPAYRPQPTQAVYRPQPTQAVYRPQPTQAVYRQQPTQAVYRPQPTQAVYRPQPTQAVYRPQPTQAVYRPQPTQAVYRPQPTQAVYRPQPQQPAYKPQPTKDVYRPQPQQTVYRPQPQQPAYKPQPTKAVYRPQPQQPDYSAQPTVQRPHNEYLPPFPKQKEPRNQYFPPQPVQPQYQPARPVSQLHVKVPTQPLKPVSNAYLPPIQSNEIIDRIPQPSNIKPIRGESLLSPQIFPQQSPAIPKTLSSCPSAMLCTAESYCNKLGVIVDTPIYLTPEQAAFRVPLIDCNIPETGAPGKCCRDANYVDPWPVNLAGVCAARNKNTKPEGIKSIDANFAEIPWQAMILQESTKSILCGGAIVGDEFVVTAASCVQSVGLNDVRVKAGEWELGRTNEPLPFQLVGAQSVDIHPEYNPATGANDMAIIRLNKRLEFATHIQPICISDQDPSPSEQCVTSGWGKQALQIHEEGAIMHVTSTSPVSRSDCGADSTGVCSTTKFDACEFDFGSALACGTGSAVRLKGIYSVENACGENQVVRFTKPDIKWINTAFADKNKPILQSRF